MDILWFFTDLLFSNVIFSTVLGGLITVGVAILVWKFFNKLLSMFS